MSSGIKNPCLSLALNRLNAPGAANLAIWVLKAPYPGGMVHHDSVWPQTLTRRWLAWQEMFALGSSPHIPIKAYDNQSSRDYLSNSDLPSSEHATSYSGRLMQNLGIDLWSWLFQGPIQNAFERSRGIASGQNKLLRLRLEIRDPNFIPLPWEIMQPMAGKPAISLAQQLLFSRTTSDVEPLESFKPKNQALNILLVLGQNEAQSSNSAVRLQLEQEAQALGNVLKAGGINASNDIWLAPVACHVEKLLQPTPAQLIDALETGDYNILFYAGHGEPAPDGGLLFLRPDSTINGTELAQVLVRTQVTLAVFNACWGAQPEQVGGQTIERSSLAEVLIHHGVPSVLGMRDSIADNEALSFIQAFAQALAARMPIDQAVAVARQQLLMLYKFNQPAWTLPVLYMHPEFEGELLKPIEEGITELPSMSPSWLEVPAPNAYVRSLGQTDQIWQIRGGLMRVGRLSENDLVIRERWASQKHAEIICRETFNSQNSAPTYFLRDFSRWGTYILRPDDGWQVVHHQEVPLQSGIQLKFGSHHGQIHEFVIESSEPVG
ncbi:MAG: CHAT domain-containing protein [Symploca sp. SIO3C6]|nr:CHAT domain-containing protein [Symploca sp. SIO3C6]